MRAIGATFASMRCDHPSEELQAVFEAGPTPLPGRKLCGLCGEMTYVVPAPDDCREAETPDPNNSGLSTTPGVAVRTHG
jgi:hypothetical protein